MKVTVFERESLSYVKAGVTADGADPGTSLTVKMAIIPEGTRPVSGDLKAAAWGTTYTSGGDTYRYAQLLVAGTTAWASGAEDIILSASSLYSVFVQVTDFPEVPMLYAGVLEVT